jgi:hypothetical protein
MSYVLIMTAFKFGNPVLLLVRVKAHDTSIHRQFHALANGATRDAFAKRRLERRTHAPADAIHGVTTYGHGSLASRLVCVARPA